MADSATDYHILRRYLCEYRFEFFAITLLFQR